MRSGDEYVGYTGCDWLLRCPLHAKRVTLYQFTIHTFNGAAHCLMRYRPAPATILRIVLQLHP